MTTTNLWTNPSFEVALVSSSSGPTAWNGGTVTRETGDARATGDWCLEITGAAGGDGVFMVQPYTTVGEFVVSFDLWSPVSSPQWGVTVYDTAFNILGGTGTFTVDPDEPRIVIPCEATVPLTQVWCSIIRQAVGAPDVIRADAFQLVEGAEAFDYFDGDTSDGGGFLYDWTGTPHDSASTKSSVLPAVDFNRVQLARFRACSPMGVG